MLFCHCACSVHHKNISDMLDYIIFLCIFFADCGRRGGFMVSVLDSGSSGSGLGPGRGHCVVLLGKALYSRGASLHPGV